MEGHFSTGKKEGSKVWESTLAQLGELTGFLSGFWSSTRRFLRSQITSFILFALIGGLSGFAWHMIRPKSYQAEMTVSYVLFEKKIYADMISKLDQLARDKSYESLSKVLSISENEAEAIKGIESFNIKREPLSKDLSVEKIPFYISVKSDDPQLLEKVGNKVVEYLDSPDFIRERMKYNIEKYTKERDFLLSRISRIDSLSAEIRANMSKEESSNNAEVNLADLEKSALELYDRLQQVNGSLKFNRNIEVLDGMVPSAKPLGPKWWKWVSMGIAAGIVLKVLFLIFASPASLSKTE